MVIADPVGEIDPEYSVDSAVPTPWRDARAVLEQAQVYWLTTVRPDGRPHQTPLVAVMVDGVMYFCTGEKERKARNLARNNHCIITTGCNTLQGLDVVVEGTARIIRDPATLERVAAAFQAKYDEPFNFTVKGDALSNAEEGSARLYAITPVKAFGFAKGDPFSQTRWRF